MRSIEDVNSNSMIDYLPVFIFRPEPIKDGNSEYKSFFIML